MTEVVPVPSAHHHGSAGAAGARRLGLVLVLVLGYLVVEVVAGILTNSLALLADAGHMLTDAVGIGLALLAIWFARRPATPEKSFGYYRVEIFAAIANAIILFGVAAYILYEAMQRFAAPPDVIGPPMLVVATFGLVVNLVSMRLLHAGAQTSLNLRGAYLEVLGDLLGSVAVIVAGLVIIVTGWTPIDPIASVVIAGLILPRTWTLLREAVGVLLEGTPSDVNLTSLRNTIAAVPGVAGVHDLHVWSLTSGINAMSAHAVLAPGASCDDVLRSVQTRVTTDFTIGHATIQVEPPGHEEQEAHL